MKPVADSTAESGELTYDEMVSEGEGKEFDESEEFDGDEETSDEFAGGKGATESEAVSGNRKLAGSAKSAEGKELAGSAKPSNEKETSGGSESAKDKELADNAGASDAITDNAKEPVVSDAKRKSATRKRADSKNDTVDSTRTSKADALDSSHEAQENVDLLVIINKQPVKLSGKPNYVLVDIFDFYKFDLTKPRGKGIVLNLNGSSCEYTAPLKDGDVIDLYWEE